MDESKVEWLREFINVLNMGEEAILLLEEVFSEICFDSQQYLSHGLRDGILKFFEKYGVTK